MNNAQRICPDQHPSTLSADRNIHLSEPIDQAAWIWHPDCAVDQAAFLSFSISFDSDGSDLIIHVSADMRFRLYCDDQQISKGPDRSDVEHWTYSSYQVQLDKGTHQLRAEVWWLGDEAPQALITHRGGFCLKADGDYHEQLSTGIAAWQVGVREGWTLINKKPPHCYHDIGRRQHIDIATWKNIANQQSASVIRKAVVDNRTGVDQVAGWKMYQSPLPAQLNRPIHTGTIRAVVENPSASGEVQLISKEACAHNLVSEFNQAHQSGSPLTIPAHTSLGIILDLEEYYCGFPLIDIEHGAGALIDWEWAEGLYVGDVQKPQGEGEGAGFKGNRSEIEGKCWYGFGHSVTCDGSAYSWQPYWWSSGRYVFLRIQSKDQELILQRIAVEETRYPLEQELTFASSNPLHEKIQPICLRVLQSCSHESYMDCPYYEQMQYVGDTRLELLSHYVMQADRRLPMRAIELADFSRSSFGFVAERTTSRWKQQSNSFAAIWVLCLHDFALWSPHETDFIKERMIGMHANLDQFLPYREADGLLHNEPGWTFIDWVPSEHWNTGYAPGYHYGRCCAIMNLFYCLALKAAAEIEETFGNQHMAHMYNEQAAATATGIKKTFWDAERKLLADDLGHQHYSQHTNCLGIIAGIFSDTEQDAVINKVINDDSLAQCTIYFKYYLFEALYRCNKATELHAEYEFWGELVDQGLKTCVEAPEPTRSDCHAWGAHPMYHLVASIAGLRPVDLKNNYQIKPCLHDLSSLDLKLPHPAGTLSLTIDANGDKPQINKTLPKNITVAKV